MKAAALRFELHIPGSESLKEKRAVLRPLIEGLRRQLSVSVSEVGYQDTWQRVWLGSGGGGSRWWTTGHVDRADSSLR